MKKYKVRRDLTHESTRIKFFFKKTRNLIKKKFAELMNEKKELNKITVTELVKRAGITRSTFYTHYDDIYTTNRIISQ